LWLAIKKPFAYRALISPKCRKQEQQLPQRHQSQLLRQRSSHQAPLGQGSGPPQPEEAKQKGTVLLLLQRQLTVAVRSPVHPMTAIPMKMLQMKSWSIWMACALWTVIVFATPAVKGLHQGLELYTISSLV